MNRPVAVLGATGFVGKHVVAALKMRGSEVRALRAPRLSALMSPSDRLDHLTDLSGWLAGCTAVVNAAGVAESAGAGEVLGEANCLMPELVAGAAAKASVRMIHISSAAVQGRSSVLDATPQWFPFSPYSISKAEGEQRLYRMGDNVCIYRPPGVHGRDRLVTQALVRLASSPLSSVAHPVTRNTPQALVENVADAVAFLATTQQRLPKIVHHPSEGLTTASLMVALGGKSPRVVPRKIATATVSGLYACARVRPGLEGYARRLEILWLGQDQAPSWLIDAGWRPIADHWSELGERVREDLQSGRQPNSSRSQ